MIVNYKCPGCGASMVYDEGTDSMVCPYCDQKVPVADIDQGNTSESSQNEQKAPKIKAKSDARDDAGNGEHAYHCPNCGAQIVTDKDTSATFCGFCGSPTLIEERLRGEWKPELLIPFAINKEQARNSFQEWTRKGILTPREFSSKTTLDKITGIYVPYWLFDYDSTINMSAAATKVRTTRTGDTEYTYTDHYAVVRNGDATFEKIPADASVNMPDEIMECLEPYDYGKMVSFDMPYLSGFQAEKYSQTAKDMSPRVKERLAKTMEETARGTISGYSSVSVTQKDIWMKEIRNTYAVLPVWMLNYNYRGKSYTLYMNGQNGQRVGKLPVSPLRALVLYLIASVIIFLIAWIIGGLIL